MLEADNVLEAVIKKLGDKYDYIKTLGTGRFANVYLVKHKVFGDERALKVMDFDFILKSLKKTKSNAQGIKQAFEMINKRFINEAKIIKRIKHPNIVEIFDIDKFIEDRKKIEVPYLTMQYIKGPSLEDIINREGPLSLESALKISEDVLSALRAIHENNIVHRDIKPANIMKDGKTSNFILIDFSIAKDIVSGTKITELGIKIGTSEYMAPEQIDYRNKIEPATDIYSFGVVLFEMLTKDLPFKGSSEEIFQKHLSEPVPDIKKWNSEIPIGIGDVIRKAMAKRPSDRFDNAEMFKNSLKKIVQSRKDEHHDLNEVLRKIGDTYEVINCLDKGGFSKAYLVRQKELDSLRVLKVLKYSLLSENGRKDIRDFKERFLSQGRFLEKINHENIVKIHDIGYAGMDEIPYLIMEYVKGKSLKEFIKGGTPIDFKVAIKIAENVLSALSKMHNCEPPIVHRDIKPASIMIEEESGKAKLIDFGIAKNINDTACITDSHTVAGTCFYMSPEQWKGDEDIYPTSDFYSLGVVLYELLAGELPFRGKNQAEIKFCHLKTPPPNVREINPDLPKGIENVIQKAMAKNPNGRYQNAGEFKKALNKLKKKRKNIKTAIEMFGLAVTIVSIILTLITIFPPSNQNEKLDAQYKKNIDSVKKFIEDGEYQKAKYYLEKARDIKSNGEISNLEETLTNKQREKMRKDFEDIKLFLKGGETKSKKKKKCLTFLKRHTNAPQNDDTEFMVNETNKYIKQLEAGIKADEEYKQHIAAAKESIQNKDYETAIGFLEKAKAIKDTEEIKNLLAEITGEKIAGMKADFNALKAFLNQEASNKDKLEKCREFLTKHLDLPENSEKDAMFLEIRNLMTQLETEIGKDEQYQICIDAAKEYIKSAEYQKAIDELEKAKKIKRDTEEAAALSKEIREKQIKIMQGDFNNLKQFLGGGATKKEKINKCQKFLEKHKNTPRDNLKRSIENETNQFISQLNTDIRAEEQYQRHIDNVNRLIKTGDYQKAEDELNKARDIKDTDEVKQLSMTISKRLEAERKNGDKEYNIIRDKMNLSKYLAFKKKYPDSNHLPDLKNRIKIEDRNLPPEKYWETPIKKNKKGCYELTFGKEHNGHIMIYIPGKKIWIDKYEVSWAQFRKFVKDAKIQFPPIEDDKFIRSSDEYPAVIPYEYAQKYCQKYGLRLPGVDEWEYAAGGGRHTYPWGNASPDKPDTNGNWMANFDSLEGTVEKDGFDGTAPVNSFDKFSSPFGVVNMAGNVWEWARGNTLKGGGFFSSIGDLKIKSSKPGNNDKEGFRCVKDEK